MKSKSQVIEHVQLFLVVISMVLAGMVYWTSISNVHAQVVQVNTGNALVSPWPIVETLDPTNITENSAVLNGKIINLGDAPLQFVELLRYTHNNHITKVIKPPFQNIVGSTFSAVDDTLYPGNTYRTFVAAVDHDGTWDGNWRPIKNFKTLGTFVNSSPEVKIAQPATNLKTNTTDVFVTLHGALTNVGNISSVVGFKVYITPNSVREMYSTKESFGPTTFDFTQDQLNLSGLIEPGKNYSYQACAIDYDGSQSCSPLSSFTTAKVEYHPDGIAPQIKSEAATNVTSSGFVMHGSVIDYAKEPIETYFKLYYTKQKADKDQPNWLVHGGLIRSQNTFQIAVGGLNSNTAYYYKACARDADGDEGCGSLIGPPVQPPVDLFPEIMTDSTNNISSNSATIVGKVVNAGNSPVTAYFLISHNQNMTSSTTYALSTTYNQGQLFSTVLAGLDSNTDYWYQACGKDSDLDNDCGEILTFKTAPTIIIDPSGPDGPGGPGGPGGGTGGPGGPTENGPTVDLSCGNKCVLPNKGNTKITWVNQYIASCTLRTTLPGVGPFVGVDPVSGFKNIYATKSFDVIMDCIGTNNAPKSDSVHICVGVIGANGACHDRNNPNFEEI